MNMTVGSYAGDATKAADYVSAGVDRNGDPRPVEALYVPIGVAVDSTQGFINIMALLMTEEEQASLQDEEGEGVVRGPWTSPSSWTRDARSAYHAQQRRRRRRRRLQLDPYPSDLVALSTRTGAQVAPPARCGHQDVVRQPLGYLALDPK